MGEGVYYRLTHNGWSSAGRAAEFPLHVRAMAAQRWETPAKDEKENRHRCSGSGERAAASGRDSASFLK